MEKTYYCFGWKTPEGAKDVFAFRTSREAASAYELGDDVPPGAVIFLFDVRAPRHLSESDVKIFIENNLNMHFSNSVIWYVKSANREALHGCEMAA